MQDIVPTLTASVDTLLTKKELAMEKAGAGRRASYEALARGLVAKKMTVDKYGEEHIEDDVPTQIRAAEIISSMNGDKKPESVVDNRSVSITINGDVSVLLDMASDVNTQLAELKTSGRQTGEVIDVEHRVENAPSS